jgi:hypothetical protein
VTKVAGARHFPTYAPCVFRRRRDRAAHDEGDELVELTRVPGLEAEVIAARLRDAGIKVAVFDTNFTQEGGFAFAQGARVMVLRRDVDTANALLEP